MIFSQDRNQIRRFFSDVRAKHRGRAPLEPLEDLIAGVILEHPEYHGLLENPDAALERDYLPELGQTNPFLHMGMHIALREQIAGQRPAAVAATYRQLSARLADSHEAEHRMIDCLAEALWQAQRLGTAPDESAYLACLQRLMQG